MAEGFLPPVVAVLTANISEFKSKMGEARKEMAETEKSGGSSFKKMAGIGQAALKGIGVAAVAVGTLAIHMADKYEDAHARLNTAINNSGGSWKQYAKGVETVTKRMANFGLGMTQVEDTLALLTQATNSPTRALQLMQVTADLAAARHLDLATAAKLVGKVAQGNTTILKRFGLDLGITAGGLQNVKKAHEALAGAQQHYQDVLLKIRTGHLKGIAAQLAYRDAIQKVKAAQEKLTTTTNAGRLGIDALSKRVKDNAAAAAETFHGKLKKLEAKIGNLLVQVGLKLIPLIMKLADWLGAKLGPIVEAVTGFFEKHQEVIKQVAKTVLHFAERVIGTLYHWMTKIIDAFRKHKVLLVALGAAVGLVAVAIAGALVAAFIAWAVAAAEAAVATLIALAPILLIIAAVAAVAAAIYEVATHWKQIWKVMQEAVKTAWEWIKKAFMGIIDWYIKLPGRLIHALAKFGGMLIHFFGHVFMELFKKLPYIVGRVLGFFIALPIVLIAKMFQFDVMLVKWATKAFVWLVTKLPGIIAKMLIWFGKLVATIIGALVDFHKEMAKWFIKHFIKLVKSLPGIIKDLLKWFKDLPGNLIHALGDIVKTFIDVGKKIIEGILKGIVGAAGGLASGLKDAVGGAAKGAWHGITGAIGSLNPFATGGIANYPKSGGLAVLHGREAVLPLGDPNRSMQILKDTGLFGKMPAQGATGMHIHGGVTIHVSSPDPGRAGQQVKRALTEAAFLHGRAS